MRSRHDYLAIHYYIIGLHRVDLLCFPERENRSYLFWSNTVARLISVAALSRILRAI